MSNKRRRYTEGFKRELVAVYEAGERSAASLEGDTELVAAICGGGSRDMVSQKEERGQA